MYLFKFFNSPVEGGKFYVQLIDLRLIIGSGYSPNALRLHLSPLFVYHASVNAVYGENWKNARLTSTDGGAFPSDNGPRVDKSTRPLSQNGCVQLCVGMIATKSPG